MKEQLIVVDFKGDKFMCLYDESKQTLHVQQLIDHRLLSQDALKEALWAGVREHLKKENEDGETKRDL